MTANLLKTTTELLNNDPRTIRQIADESGVNFHWLGKFKQGAFTNPGVVTVERLYTYLTRAAAR